MAQKYTPIWDDWFEVTQELNAQEKGRLVDAIVAYDNGGDWQEQIKGNERYVFPGYRSRIDRYKEICGIRTTSAKESKPKQTEAKVSKTQQNSNDNDNDNDIKETTLKGSKESDRLFDKFWSVYPRHEGKQSAVKAFNKAHPDEQLLETMINAILKQKQTDQWSDPRYIPHPATWLNGRRWEDEPVKGNGGKRVLAQNYEQREYHEEEMRELLGVDDLYREDAG